MIQPLAVQHNLLDLWTAFNTAGHCNTAGFQSFLFFPSFPLMCFDVPRVPSLMILHLKADKETQRSLSAVWFPVSYHNDFAKTFLFFFSFHPLKRSKGRRIIFFCNKTLNHKELQTLSSHYYSGRTNLSALLIKKDACFDHLMWCDAVSCYYMRLYIEYKTHF